MRTRSTLICSFSALFCASSSSISSFRLSLSSESSVSGGIPDLNQPRVMRSMPKARVKPTQTGEQLQQKRMNKTQPVPCVVRTSGLADEDSLAENIHREALHPLDQFRAFQTLRAKGLSEEDTAPRCFIRAPVFPHRLNLSPS